MTDSKQIFAVMLHKSIDYWYWYKLLPVFSKYWQYQ